MFSSFDAACNEFLNQKVKSSFAFTAMDSNTKRVSSSKVGEDDLIKNQEGSSSRSWTRKQEKKTPREETDRNYSLIDLSEAVISYVLGDARKSWQSCVTLVSPIRARIPSPLLESACP
ncbi:hypothetical protein DKX38_018008 [Salix brachista]|uniref:Uncharacterized protein n=1 Tax=Salix brachista TaxID=2182728 RepID=A0A5N5KX68_9ROSI|nr:hypothetical protein DKX38_018008 [Salix brachista]